MKIVRSWFEHSAWDEPKSILSKSLSSQMFALARPSPTTNDANLTFDPGNPVNSANPFNFNWNLSLEIRSNISIKEVQELLVEVIYKPFRVGWGFQLLLRWVGNNSKSISIVWRWLLMRSCFKSEIFGWPSMETMCVACDWPLSEWAPSELRWEIIKCVITFARNKETNNYFNSRLAINWEGCHTVRVLSGSRDWNQPIFTVWRSFVRCLISYSILAFRSEWLAFVLLSFIHCYTKQSIFQRMFTSSMTEWIY